MPDPEELLDDAEIVDQFRDALGDKVRIGWLPGAVLVGVSGSPAILSTPELRNRFARAYAEAERRAEAVTRAVTPGQPSRVKHGPWCACTPCKAEPSYAARRAQGQTCEGGC